VSQWEILTDYFESFNVPVYPVQGNHDIRDSDTKWNEVYYQPEYWLDTFHGWLDYSNTTNTAHKYENPVSYSTNNNYYDTEINGHHYIFLEMPKMEGDHYAFGEEQLAWLDKKLYENEGTGKPTFVFTHVPTDSNMNGGTSGGRILDNDEFLAVLDKHPTTVVVSGHTHYTLDTEFYSSVDGGQESVSMIHDGGSSLVAVLENGVVNEYPGSHGVIVEVYSDKILIKGRNFMEDKWISKAYTSLSMKESLETDVTLVKDVSDDGTTSVYLKGDFSSFNCTYIVDGEESYVITDDTDYVAVRIENSEGLFTTLFYDDVSLIAPDFEAPSMIEGQDIRFDNIDEGTECSVRFKASVTAAQQNEASEYGFIVTRKSFLDRMEEKAAAGEDVETDLTFNFSYNGTDLFAYGSAYLVDENGEASINKFIEIDDNGDIIFASVLKGIKNNDSVHVNEVFSVRPYIRISDGNNEYIFYGECSSASLADAVKAVDTSDLPDSYKKIIEDIIALGA